VVLYIYIVRNENILLCFWKEGGGRDIGARTQKRNKLWDDSSDVGKKLKKL
jgi:hypothetical protein